MSTGQAEGRDALPKRVRGLLFKPSSEWSEIAGEASSAQQLLLGYVAPLAAIPAICGLVGAVVFGYQALGVTYRPTLLSALSSAAAGYVLTFLAVGLLALVINALAPSFGGQRNSGQALKLAAYSGTPGWLAGVFALVPPLAILGVLGLYGVYLVFRGAPILMRTPREKAGLYTAAIVVCAALLWLVMGLVSSQLVGPARTFGADAGAASGRMSGSVSIPGAGSVDLGQLEKAAKELERSYTPGATQSAPPLSVEKLKSLAPQRLIGGFEREAIETTTGAIGPVSGSGVTTRYTRGDQRLTLRIMDVGSSAPFLGIAGAMGMEGAREDENGYERISNRDGQLTIEELDRASGKARYAMLRAQRFMIEAEGTDVPIADLKRVVEEIHPQRGL